MSAPRLCLSAASSKTDYPRGMDSSRLSWHPTAAFAYIAALAALALGCSYRLHGKADVLAPQTKITIGMRMNVVQTLGGEPDWKSADQQQWSYFDQKGENSLEIKFAGDKVSKVSIESMDGT
jgi:hypothetical protein